MNPFEFVSKTMLVYSFRRKNERIDLSQLPDDIFDKVLLGLSSTNMCQEGSVFTGKFIMDKEKATRFVTMLETDVAPTYPRIRQLIAYLHALGDGDVFRIVSEDAPTMNKQLAILKTNGQKTGENEQVIHNRYLLAWGPLTTTFRHLAFGYDGIRTVIGEGDMPYVALGVNVPDVRPKGYGIMIRTLHKLDLIPLYWEQVNNEFQTEFIKLSAHINDPLTKQVFPTLEVCWQARKHEYNACLANEEAVGEVNVLLYHALVNSPEFDGWIRKKF